MDTGAGVILAGTALGAIAATYWCCLVHSSGDCLLEDFCQGREAGLAQHYPVFERMGSYGSELEPDNGLGHDWMHDPWFDFI